MVPVMPERLQTALAVPQRFTRRVHDWWEKALSTDRWQQWMLVGIILLAALALRRFLAPEVNPNYTDYIGPWFEYLKAGGFSALGEEFANYNVSYLYILFLGTLTPFEPLYVVKAIAIGFDILMAVGVAAIVLHFRRSALLAAAAGGAALFAPEVFLNSAMWGQADSTYTAFLVWAAYFVVTRRDIAAWLMFSLAFSFKLQAMFVLPWMLVALIAQRHRIRALLLAVALFFVIWIPAIIAGRSIGSLARIYLAQTGPSRLSEYATNMYLWIPTEFYEYARPAGLAFGLGIVSLLALLYLRRRGLLERPELWLLQVAAAYAVLVPFSIPQMHDRFFFTAGVFTLICAMLMREYLIPAIALQFTAVMALSVALFRVPPPIPLEWAAVLQLVVVMVVVGLSLLRPKQEIGPYFPAVVGLSIAATTTRSNAKGETARS